MRYLEFYSQTKCIMKTQIIFNIIIFYRVAMTINGHLIKKRTFLLEKGRCILDNATTFLSGPYESRSHIECANICRSSKQCQAAEYNKIESFCNLYTDAVVRPVISIKNSSGYSVLKGRRKPFPSLLDPSTLYEHVYMSNDGRFITGHNMTGYQKWPLGINSLTNYRGSIAKECVKPGQVVMYEVEYEYNLIQPLPQRRLMTVEFAIAEKSKIDNSYWAGDSVIGGWSFTLLKCDTDYVCLEALHNSRNKFAMHWSNNTAGTIMNGTFIVVVNRKNNLFTLYDGKNGSKIFQHTDVISNADLCPALMLQGLEHLSMSFETTIGINKAEQIL